MDDSAASQAIINICLSFLDDSYYYAANNFISRTLEKGPAQRYSSEQSLEFNWTQYNIELAVIESVVKKANDTCI